MNNLKGHSGVSETSPKTSKLEDSSSKKKAHKQLKLDRFITKQKPKSSHSEHGSDDETANSRRSATMKAKNYSELESDTESLLEVSVGGISSSVKSSTGKKQKSDINSKSKKK